MIEAKYYDLAAACVDHYFKDCTLRELVLANTVSKPSSSRYLSISGKPTSITCSRTTKVVINDNRKCVECGVVAKYALHLFNVNSKKDMLCFVAIVDGRFVPLTKDHIVAKMSGGRDTLKNLQSMCYECNQDKANKSVEKISEDGKTITIPLDEYHRLNTKQTDFASVRSIIKKSIKRVPWWMKLLRVDKYMEKKIKEPIHDMGYYGNNLTND